MSNKQKAATTDVTIFICAIGIGMVFLMFFGVVAMRNAYPIGSGMASDAGDFYTGTSTSQSTTDTTCSGQVSPAADTKK